MGKTSRKHRISILDGQDDSSFVGGIQDEKDETCKEEIIEVVVGLDASSSCIGVCVLESVSGNLVLLDHIDLTSTKFDNEYKKADFVNVKLQKMISTQKYKIENIFIEEAVKMFGTGFSSAGTITTLNRFNGIVSYLVYKLFEVTPKAVNVRSARAILKIKVNQKIKKIVSSKQQVFDIVK